MHVRVRRLADVLPQDRRPRPLADGAAGRQLRGHAGHGDCSPVPAPGGARLGSAIVPSSSPATWRRPLGMSLQYLSTGLFQLLIWATVSSCPHVTFTGSVLCPPGTHRPRCVLPPSAMSPVFHRGPLVTQDVVGYCCISSQLGLSLSFCRASPKAGGCGPYFRDPGGV